MIAIVLIKLIKKCGWVRGCHDERVRKGEGREGGPMGKAGNEDENAGLCGYGRTVNIRRAGQSRGKILAS